MEHKNEAERLESTNEMFQSYANFKYAVRQLYGNPTERNNTRRDLEKLQQVGSVGDYYSKFQYHASKIGWDIKTLKYRFYEGLKEDVKDEISRDDWLELM